MMIWFQGAICLVLWIGFGGFSIWKALGTDLPKKPWAGIGLMAVGGIFMVMGMMLLAANGGMSGGQLTPLGWIGTAVLGLVFIGAQSYGSMWVLKSVMVRETRDNGDASKVQDLEK